MKIYNSGKDSRKAFLSAPDERWRRKRLSVFRLVSTFVLLLVLPGVVVQSSSLLSSQESDSFQQKVATQSGTSISIAIQPRARFQGKLYFTIDRDLYVLDDKLNLRRLTTGMDVRNPAVSPDGKTIAFIDRFTNYSNLMIMSATGGTPKILLSGNGSYETNPYSDMPKATYVWYSEPSWSPDGKTLLFLSDREKMDVVPCSVDSFLLDMQIFTLSLDHPNVTPQVVAYATYGDGGLESPSYRPGYPDQILFTGFSYTADSSQSIQLYMENPDAIAESSNRGYQPGAISCESDPSVPITGAGTENIQPSFSPDGNTILYVRRDNVDQMSLYAMPVPEGIIGNPKSAGFDPNSTANLKKGLSEYDKSVQLLTGQYLSEPAWSPDGKQIVYYSYANNSFDIWIATVTHDSKTHQPEIKPDSEIQLTQTNGQLDAASNVRWTV